MIPKKNWVVVPSGSKWWWMKMIQGSLGPNQYLSKDMVYKMFGQEIRAITVAKKNWPRASVQKWDSGVSDKKGSNPWLLLKKLILKPSRKKSSIRRLTIWTNCSAETTSIILASSNSFYELYTPLENLVSFIFLHRQTSKLIYLMSSTEHRVVFV